MKCFRTRGKKGAKHADLADPPRRRTNKRRGHGTYANDRPPIVGTVGRKSGQVRLRVVKRTTTTAALQRHVQTFTSKRAYVYTDEWRGYAKVGRQHATVEHSRYEWVCDDDGDGVREMHTNTVKGMWTSVRNFLRPFRGVHKQYLSQYVAVCEFGLNLAHVSPEFLSKLVGKHSF